ncbi:uncharacterized protein EDB91DRAFT_1054813 [Suillus paluster]|uniref:uncharacterized protein n=1 Tax=Suillus paluster TaxID=48578 RepID=UPI001B85D74D|nr:uncharacterized protein EDB91DRAFT_1054813 [Suillus paluster]KAG1737906.1 hypothetical protein EDB91DRAFT_1054813 [Suillus paluster]
MLEHSKLADLVAKHGNSTSTAWLETERYHTWQPSEAIPESSFTPVQGYLHSNSWVFAWGNPIISDPKALKPTAQAFASFVESKGMKCVYCCVDDKLDEILSSTGWSTVSCINEDVVDPERVIELTSDTSEGDGSMAKDLRKNLRRAERAHIDVTEINRDQWSDAASKEIQDGVAAWKKSRTGLQLAATSFDPFLDFDHRRYWVARSDGKVVGVLILTPVQDSFVIKNAVAFPQAPKGTSEYLITSALTDLRNEFQSDTGSVKRGDISVTFNVSAASDLKPTKNISGWKFTWLNKTYSNVNQGAGLLNRGNFRSKFDASREPMFVCYSTEDGFGLDGIETLLKLLRR